MPTQKEQECATKINEILNEYNCIIDSYAVLRNGSVNVITNVTEKPQSETSVEPLVDPEVNQPTAIVEEVQQEVQPEMSREDNEALPEVVEPQP